jgi:ABC-type transport system involved in cytochrome bd biosynthesis fused ATPase/permease subunit
LARLFLRDVDTVMLDEPTEQLDPGTRERVWDGLERFVQGRTMILVTHRREEAARAHRVVALVGPVAAETASEVAPG